LVSSVSINKSKSRPAGREGGATAHVGDRRGTKRLEPARPHAAVIPRSTNLIWRLIKVDGRPREIVDFEEAVVAFFLDSATVLGVPKSVAAIYGICFASPEPLSFGDVQRRLDISAGSISQGLRVLQEVGALKLLRTEGDRRDFYTPDLELRKVIVRYLEQRLETQLHSGRGRLLAIANAVPMAQSKELKIRLKSLRTWHEQARAVLPIVKAFLKLT
jgi:HTH-type transcriptional regulator, glycine betaine synthesis regulator